MASKFEVYIEVLKAMMGWEEQSVAGLFIMLCTIYTDKRAIRIAHW